MEGREERAHRRTRRRTRRRRCRPCACPSSCARQRASEQTVRRVLLLCVVVAEHVLRLAFRRHRGREGRCAGSSAAGAADEQRLQSRRGTCVGPSGVRVPVHASLPPPIPSAVSGGSGGGHHRARSVCSTLALRTHDVHSNSGDRLPVQLRPAHRAAFSAPRRLPRWHSAPPRVGTLTCAAKGRCYIFSRFARRSIHPAPYPSNEPVRDTALRFGPTSRPQARDVWKFESNVQSRPLASIRAGSSSSRSINPFCRHPPSLTPRRESCAGRPPPAHVARAYHARRPRPVASIRAGCTSHTA